MQCIVYDVCRKVHDSEYDDHYEKCKTFKYIGDAEEWIEKQDSPKEDYIIIDWDCS